MIERAKGIIAASLGCKMVEAFNRLRGFARSSQARLSGVAGEVVAGSSGPRPIGR